jgi:PAS domain S-box-containing protein
MTASTEDPLLPVIRAALDQTRSAACITTAELDHPGPRIVYINSAYCAMTGRTEDEVLGQTPRIMQGPLTSRRVLDRLRRDLEAGQPFIGETVNYRQDGEPYLNSWRIDPVLDDAGVTTHYIATQGDITEIRRAQRLLDAEKAIDRSLSVLLSKSAEAETNLALLAEDIRAAIDGLVDYGAPAVFGSIRLGTTTVDLRAGPASDAQEVIDGLTSPHGTSQVGGASDRRWIGCSLSDARAGIDAGVAVVGLTRPELEFTDRLGLERLAECAKRAVESLAEYERQRLVAIELQRDLLPAGKPSAPGLEIAAQYRPGAFATGVGGDWYDVIGHEGGAVLVVGDLAGSGIRAAADMGRVRLLTKMLVRQGAALPDVFAELNRFCADEDLMATALAINVEPATGSITIVSAGHPPPVVRRDDGADVVWLTPGPPLGIGGDASYPSQNATIEPGEVVAMFTDGLVERRDESIDRSIEKLAVRISDLPTNTEAVADGLLGACAANDSTDDTALLTFEVARRI